MKPLRLLAGLLALAFSLLSAAPAHAWWDGEWSTRKKVVIDTGVADAAITDPVGAAVVLLRLHEGNFQFGLAKEDGSDIRIVAEDDKTLLPYHLERYDSLLNEAFLWVKVPEVKPGAKLTLWLYYGGSGAKATRVEDAKATYDAQTTLVYHFAEKSGPATDATGKGGSAQNAGVAVSGSLIGGGTKLDGKTPITIPASDALAWGEGMPLTWSLWVKPAALVPNAIVFSRRAEGKSLVIGLDNGVPYLALGTGDEPKRVAGATALAATSWHHLAIVSDAGKTSLFVDGDVVATLATNVPAMNTPLLLGGDTAEGATPFTGEIDELNIAKAARTAGVIKLAALSQGAGEKAGKIVAVGADEQTSSWFSGGFFGIIIKSLTLDGWIVIGILGVMLLISWYVMVSKVKYLNGMAKGNAIFMKQWAHLASDLTALDHGTDKETVRSLAGRLDGKAMRTMRNSSVYRIYHTGVEEIRHRLAADHSSKVLSARSIQSIRACLDGSQVREKQKIDKLIVLLTICISGGPFLGLLGTVVGVMITFAAVAAAGDVNVNAIAPGIAAALLATVAGLAVAIPSLFGYNYILARVKDSTADMHVFIDEFVTRMAEFYSEPEYTNRRGAHLNSRPSNDSDLVGAH